VIASSYETDTAKVRKKYDGRLVSMQAIVILLQGAGRTRTPCSSRQRSQTRRGILRGSSAPSGSSSVEGIAAAAAAASFSSRLTLFNSSEQQQQQQRQ